MTGFQEILLLIVLIAAILLFPRMTPAAKANRAAGAKRRGPLFSGPVRLAILASLLWPVVLAVATRPWSDSQNLMLFLLVGPAPVAVCALIIPRGRSTAT